MVFIGTLALSTAAWDRPGAVVRPLKQPSHPGGTGAQTRPVQTAQANLRSEDSFRSRHNGLHGILVQVILLRSAISLMRGSRRLSR